MLQKDILVIFYIIILIIQQNYFQIYNISN